MTQDTQSHAAELHSTIDKEEDGRWTMTLAVTYRRLDDQQLRLMEQLWLTFLASLPAQAAPA